MQEKRAPQRQNFASQVRWGNVAEPRATKDLSLHHLRTRALEMDTSFPGTQDISFLGPTGGREFEVQNQKHAHARAHHVGPKS